MSRDFRAEMDRLYSFPGETAGSAEALGRLMRNLLNPEPAPGPPYTHTIVPPEPIGWDEDGEPIYPEPGPAFTVTEGS